jgi:ABC-type multidrug transport system ATPase subunit
MPDALPAPAPVVEAVDLSRRFGGRWAYARVDLRVEPGERVLVFGANGSGKTTLLRTLSTLLRPSHGTLRLFGQDPSRPGGEALRRRIGFLSHQPGLYEDLSGADNLRVFARLAGRPVDAAALLARVGLDARPEPIRAWSAGMRKRLQIAALLGQSPDLILADEPFTALDPEGVHQVVALLAALPGTLILSTHNLARAASLCGRALLLDAGVPRWSGPAAQVTAAWAALFPQGDAEAAE